MNNYGRLLSRGFFYSLTIMCDSNLASAAKVETLSPIVKLGSRERLACSLTSNRLLLQAIDISVLNVPCGNKVLLCLLVFIFTLRLGSLLYFEQRRPLASIFVDVDCILVLLIDLVNHASIVSESSLDLLGEQSTLECRIKRAFLLHTDILLRLHQLWVFLPVDLLRLLRSLRCLFFRGNALRWFWLLDALL